VGVVANRSRARALIVAAAMAVLVSGLTLVLPRSALASCVMPSPLPDRLQAARAVFVGTVVSVSDRGRRAQVSVETIWKGPDLPREVEVLGSSAGSGGATSIDRTFQANQRYLFVLADERPPFTDNSCSATQPFTAAVAAYTPADARPVSADGAGSGTRSSPGIWGIFAAAGAGGVLLAITVVLRRRRQL
jgi:hypothetical protein